MSLGTAAGQHLESQERDRFKSQDNAYDLPMKLLHVRNDTYIGNTELVATADPFVGTSCPGVGALAAALPGPVVEACLCCGQSTAQVLGGVFY